MVRSWYRTRDEDLNFREFFLKKLTWVENFLDQKQVFIGGQRQLLAY